jgi:O-antigen ligase
MKKIGTDQYPATSQVKPADYTLFAWARSVTGWILFLFVLGTVCLSEKGRTQSLGILLCFAFVVTAARQKNSPIVRLLPAPPELLCFSAWVIWAVVTGPCVAVNMELFWVDARKILQICVMAWVVYGTVRLQRKFTNAVLMGIICGALIVTAQLFMNLDSFALSAQTEQADGGTGNANALGHNIVFAMFCFLALWGFSGRLKKMVLIAGLICMPLFGYAILASGSRKSVLALLLLLGAWMILGASSRARMAAVIRVGALILSVALLVHCLPYLMDNTLVGQRFQEFLKGGNGSLEQAAEGNVRYQMYVQGLRMFSDNPLCGVGLGNFRERFFSGHYSNLYSHSDYIEPLATTGLPGFMLYQSIYFIILYRTIRLIRVVQDEAVLYRLKMTVVLIGIFLFLGIGTPFFGDLPMRVLAVTFSVYTAGVASDIRRLTPASHAYLACSPPIIRVSRKSRHATGTMASECSLESFPI